MKKKIKGVTHGADSSVKAFFFGNMYDIDDVLE